MFTCPTDSDWETTISAVALVFAGIARLTATFSLAPPLESETAGTHVATRGNKNEEEATNWKERRKKLRAKW
jgi:hypothetical protein